MPGREKLPDTLKRSPAKAQRTWMKTHDSAVKEYMSAPGSWTSPAALP